MTVKIPNLAPELVKIADILPYEKNVKQHPKDQVEKIKASILEFGFRWPLLLKSKDVKEIVAGHGRLIAAQELGMTEVPCLYAGDMNDNQIKAFRIMDNKSAESGWETAFLVEELHDLMEDDYSLDLTGFDEEEIKGLVGVENEGEAQEDDYDVDKALEKPKYEIKQGDIWVLGEHRLMCGDSTRKDDVNWLMNGVKADMLFSDPPYNVDYGANKHHPNWNVREIKGDKQSSDDWLRFNKMFITNVIEHTKGGDVYIWGASGPDGMVQRLMLTEMGFHWSATIIWKKQQLVLSPAKYQRMYEPCFYGWFEKSTFCADRKQTEVWEFDRPLVSKLHPTMKPIPMCGYGISNSSQAGDIVLDLFGGSGSTLMAAEQLKRKCFIMELDPRYCSVIIERWQDFTGRKARKEGVPEPENNA